MSGAVAADHFLAHYGIKGMKWGVRKEPSRGVESLNIRSKGVTVRSDGSIDVAKGASLQRLVRSNGKSLPMKDLTYASLSEYDNARYIKTIAGKGFFGGGRDKILHITATKPIKAPSIDKATRMVSDMMLTDAQFRKKNTSMLGESISNKELDQIRKDPGGKTARAWYEVTNTKLTFDKEFDPDAPFVQKAFREKMKSEGYNAVRDENDVVGKIAKSPIIVFEPENSLKVTSSTMVTDEIRRANKETLSLYKSLGKDWVDRELYED